MQKITFETKEKVSLTCLSFTPTNETTFLYVSVETMEKRDILELCGRLNLFFRFESYESEKYYMVGVPTESVVEILPLD